MGQQKLRETEGEAGVEAATSVRSDRAGASLREAAGGLDASPGRSVDVCIETGPPVMETTPRFRALTDPLRQST